MIIATNPNATKAICKVSPMWNEFDFFITKSFCSVQFNSAFQRGVGEVVSGGGIATVFQQVDTNVTLELELANRKYTF